MSTTSPELARVKRAAHRERRSREEYRRSLLEAREAGATLQEIATAAGVTRQAVYQALKLRS